MAAFLKVSSIPLVIFAIGVAGLVCALVGDGMWDAVSWVALTVPLVLIVNYAVLGRSDRARASGR